MYTIFEVHVLGIVNPTTVTISDGINLSFWFLMLILFRLVQLNILVATSSGASLLASSVNLVLVAGPTYYSFFESFPVIPTTISNGFQALLVATYSNYNFIGNEIIEFDIGSDFSSANTGNNFLGCEVYFIDDTINSVFAPASSGSSRLLEEQNCGNNCRRLDGKLLNCHYHHL